MDTDFLTQLDTDDIIVSQGAVSTFCRALVDYGCTQVIIDPEVAHILELQLGDKRHIQTGAGAIIGHESMVDRITISEGGEEKVFKDVPVVVYPLKSMKLPIGTTVVLSKEPSKFLIQRDERDAKR